MPFLAHSRSTLLSVTFRVAEGQNRFMFPVYALRKFVAREVPAGDDPQYNAKVRKDGGRLCVGHLLTPLE